MLTITIENRKVVIENLQGLAGAAPQIITNVLKRSAVGVHRDAFDKLSGPAANTGGYPVPVVTGNLRRLLNWLAPGDSKDGFSAGDRQSVVYNSAEYARAVHQGTKQHSKYGARPYLTDAFDAFNRSGRIEQIANEELDKALRKHNLN